MKILLMIGDSLRHKKIAIELYKKNMLGALIIETRETMMPCPPSYLDEEMVALFNKHFEERLNAEEKFFSDVKGFVPQVPTLTLTREELNGEKMQEFIKCTPHDMAISYGVHFLSNKLLDCINGEKWNIHGGLSPWYRGCTTHFWPSYMLEPQMTGMTVHCLTQKLDGGEIVHHSTPSLVRGDGLHDLACRAVLTVANELSVLVEMLAESSLKPYRKQKTSGKIWLERDWVPECLRQIYLTYENRVVDYYLDGRFGTREVELFKQF